jgi:hypothetical protein
MPHGSARASADGPDTMENPGPSSCFKDGYTSKPQNTARPSPPPTTMCESDSPLGRRGWVRWGTLRPDNGALEPRRARSPRRGEAAASPSGCAKDLTEPLRPLGVLRGQTAASPRKWWLGRSVPHLTRPLRPNGAERGSGGRRASYRSVNSVGPMRGEGKRGSARFIQKCEFRKPHWGGEEDSGTCPGLC